METEPTEKQGRAALIIIILVIVLAGSFIAYLERGSLYTELGALNLIPTPERFTELYFANAASLPTEAITGEPITFSFVIHNVEGVTTSYPYTVYITYPSGKSITLANGLVTLGNGASTTIPIEDAFTTLGKGTVVVDLTSLDQQIDFLLK